MTTIISELLERIRLLSTDEQQRVLDFVRELREPQGEPVEQLVARARAIAFPKEDLEEMKQFIEEEFERIDPEEWDQPPALT